MVFLLFLGSVAVIEWILGREERARHDPPSQADPKETNTADLLALAREVDCGKQTTPVRQDAISEVISTPPLSAADLKRNV